MPDTHIIILIGAIAFGATLVRSTLGFGDALIAMPLLAFIIPLKIAAPYIAALSVFNAIVILAQEWRHISFREMKPLIIASLCGIPFGVWMLRDGDPRIVTGLLAVLVLSFSIWNLCRPDSLQLQTDRSAPLFGFISGVLGGAYNTAGPTLVIFGTLRRWPTQRFRANLQSYFIVGGTTVFLSHIWHGNVTAPVMKLFAICVPLTMISAAVGRRITQSVPTARFTRFVHIGLLLIGLILLGRTLLP
ncbi:MAG: sulfite exporter TauE/SafE family protein [Planctomycetota bacterium]